MQEISRTGENPYFSVVIPTYNRATSINATVRSVMDQEFTDWELLVVDDGSDDETCEIVRQLGRGDPRIQLLHRPKNRPKGANACRNIGMESARGIYVALLDSDDIWYNARLVKAYDYLVVSGYDAIYSGAIINNGQDKKIRSSRDRSGFESTVDFLMAKDVFTPTPSYILKSDLGREIRFDESLQRHQDMDFFIRFAEKHDWKYFENFDVEVYWEKGRQRKLHYESMIRYYERHKPSMSNGEAQFTYLWWCFTSAIDEDSKYISYYKNELWALRSKLGFMRKLKAMFPILYYRLWRILRG